MSTELIASEISRSHLFDEDYYLRTYPDVAAAGVNALQHFILHGAGEGRNPNSVFNTAFYLKSCAVPVDRIENPLLHYLRLPRHKRAATHHLFDAQCYQAFYPEVLAGEKDPLLHYLEIGQAQRRRASVIFDPEFYLSTYTDVAAAGLNPLEHFTLYGKQEGRLARKREAADYDLASFKSILKSLKSLRQKTDVRANYKNVFWGSPLIDQRHASQFTAVAAALPALRFYIPVSLMCDFPAMNENVEKLSERNFSEPINFSDCGLFVNAIDGVPFSELMFKASDAGLLLLGSDDSELPLRLSPDKASILPQGISDSKLVHALTYHASNPDDSFKRANNGRLALWGSN